MEKRYYLNWDSPLGRVTVCCSERGVCEVSLGTPAGKRAGRNGSRQPSTEWIPAERSRQNGARLARRAIAELKEYFAGRRQRFDVPLDLRGTSFQLKVWKALTQIPYGQTRSYRQIAGAVGNPRAARAVGLANHCNPVGILVPCHRVVSSDGSLGGYASGLENKAWMLQLEQGNRSRRTAT